MLIKTQNEHFLVLSFKTLMKTESLDNSCAQVLKQRFPTENTWVVIWKILSFPSFNKQHLSPSTATTHYEGDHRPQIRSSQII